MEVATIQKWGNSQGIRIPKHLLASLQWRQDEKIIMIAQDNKLLIEKAPTNQRKNIKELFQGFNPESYTPCEIDWSEPVGKEIW